MTKLNLILGINFKEQNPNDFVRIKERIAILAPEIRTTIVSVNRFNVLTRIRCAFGKTLLVLVNGSRKMNVFRGHVIKPGAVGKIEGYRTMEAIGIPIPKWTEIEPDMALDPAEWGDYVVVKPDKGSRGAYVTPVRTRRVRHKKAEDLPADHPGRLGPLLAQRLIYTGRWPVSYRVMSVLGRAVYCVKYEGSQAKPPLESANSFRNTVDQKSISILATARGCRITMANEPDIIDLAIRAHAAFPDVAMLGCDIVREESTGRLFVLEANQEGCVWHLSTRMGIEMQSDFGLDFYGQFGAINSIAEALIKATREKAK